MRGSSRFQPRRQRRRLQQKLGESLLILHRKPDDGSLLNRPLRRLLRCRHNEIAQTAAFNLGGTPDNSQCVRGDSGLDTGATTVFRWHWGASHSCSLSRYGVYDVPVNSFLFTLFAPPVGYHESLSQFPTGESYVDLEQLAAGVRLLLMDVDGVMTDGKLYNVPAPDGRMAETKGFDAQDGISLQWLSWYGIKTGLISGRVSPATEERAKQCKFSYIYQGHIEKIPILEEILADAKIAPQQVAYIGDDLTDIVIMRRVGLTFAPANARPEVKQAAHMVLAGRGGNGAVREVAEFILKAKGHWTELLKKYEV
jgi:3-deoxy-D-manno-octulosonate 8-phosphate phosphatase (KDO 8-P phosphatase)